MTHLKAMRWQMCPKGFLSASELLFFFFFFFFPLITRWVEKKQERNGKLVKEIQKKGARMIFNERDWGSIIERQREIEMQMFLFFAEGEGNVSSSYSWGHVMITLCMKIFTNSVKWGRKGTSASNHAGHSLAKMLRKEHEKREVIRVPRLYAHMLFHS